GAVPVVEVGNVASGEEASVTANDTENGVSLDFVLPQGERGATGPAPEITVAEDSETVYKVNFKTDNGEIVSPNLMANKKYYNYDLSNAGSSAAITIGKLLFTVQYNSSSAIRLIISPADVSVPILADIRRTSIYDGGSIESSTYNNTSVTGNIVIDDVVYSQSQETHTTRIRQQDPDTGLWSMCVVSTFPSNGGARTTVWVDWIYTGASFVTP
ncbi:MAG: collagen-like protein, partial [Clostridia bacterium]|nr:collagen-like protein [Clostridia bacterium]